MPHYMIFRAQTPPNFNFETYQRHSSEPIRFDTVTVVEADSPDEAIDALIGSIGVVVTGFAAVEVYFRSYRSDTKLGRGGVLKASGPKELTNGDGSEE